MASAAAIAFGCAREWEPDCQQGRCQRAIHGSHWTFHDRNCTEDAIFCEKAYYFFLGVLYRCARVTDPERGPQEAESVEAERMVPRLGLEPRTN